MVKKSDIMKINKGITYKGIKYNKAEVKVEKFLNSPREWQNKRL